LSGLTPKELGMIDSPSASSSDSPLESSNDYLSNPPANIPLVTDGQEIPWGTAENINSSTPMRFKETEIPWKTDEDKTATSSNQSNISSSAN